MQGLSSESDRVETAKGLLTRSRTKMMRPEPPDNMIDNSSSSGTSNDGIDLLIRACELKATEKGTVTNGTIPDEAPKTPANRKRTRVETMPIIGFDVIKKMTTKKLVECFTMQQSNEMARRHKLICMLMPDKCQHEEISFGSELSAEKQMIKHLLEHRAQLQKEAEDTTRNSEFEFFAVPMQAKTATLTTRFTRTSPKNGRKENMSGTKKKPAKTSDTKSPSVENENSSSPEVLRENASTRKRKGKDGDSMSASKNPKTEKKTSKKKAPVQMPQNTSQMNRWILLDHCYTTEFGKSEGFLDYKPDDEVPGTPQDPAPVPILPLNIPPTNRQELPMVSEEVILGSEPTCPSTVTTREEPVAGPSHAMNVRNARQPRVPRKRGKTGQQRITRRAPAPEIDPEIRTKALQCLEELKNRPKAGKNQLALVCKICQDPFTAAASLTYHYRSHAGLKPFKCDICQSDFTRQHSLNYHAMTHSGTTRFTCSVCKKEFRHPNHFKEHMRKHTGETPFECGDCHMKFKTRNTYKRHLKTRHGKILTAKGIHTLSAAEFQKVKTKPYKTFQPEDDVTKRSDTEKVIMKKRSKKPDSCGDPAPVPAPVPAPMKVCLEMQASAGKPSRVG